MNRICKKYPIIEKLALSIVLPIIFLIVLGCGDVARQGTYEREKYQAQEQIVSDIRFSATTSVLTNKQQEFSHPL